MKIFQNVRGSMENVPSIEVNVDTVYIRTNIVRIEEMDFSGWEYDEIQYDKDNYIELMSGENKELKVEVLDLKSVNRMNLLALMELDARIGGE